MTESAEEGEGKALLEQFEEFEEEEELLEEDDLEGEEYDEEEFEEDLPENETADLQTYPAIPCLHLKYNNSMIYVFSPPEERTSQNDESIVVLLERRYDVYTRPVQYLMQLLMQELAIENDISILFSGVELNFPFHQTFAQQVTCEKIYELHCVALRNDLQNDSGSKFQATLTVESRSFLSRYSQLENLLRQGGTEDQPIHLSDSDSEADLGEDDGAESDGGQLPLEADPYDDSEEDEAEEEYEELEEEEESYTIPGLDQVTSAARAVLGDDPKISRERSVGSGSEESEEDAKRQKLQ